VSIDRSRTYSKNVCLITALTWLFSSSAGCCAESDLQRTLHQLKPATSSLSKGAFEFEKDTVFAPVGVITAPSTGLKSNVAGEVALNRPVTDKWALVVGVSKFQDPTIPSLRYAAKDAQDFADFLVEKANFARDHVRVLVNEQATQRQILSALGDKFLPQVVKKDDLVVIFYSSHGSPASRDVAKANFLVAYDTQKNDLFATGIEAANLTRLLRERLHAQRILIIMDACHSGGGADGAKDSSSGSNFDLQQLPLGEGQMLISSSAEDERSWESKRYKNGIFTHHLLQSMEKNARRTSVSTIFQDMLSSVENEVQQDDAATQTPKLRSDMWSGNDLILAAVPADPHPLPSQVKQWFESQVVATRPSPTRPPAAKPGSMKPTIATQAASSPKPASVVSSNTANGSSTSNNYAGSESAAPSAITAASSVGSAKPASRPAIVFSPLPGAKPSTTAVTSNATVATNSGVSQNANGFPNGGLPNSGRTPNFGAFPNPAGFPNSNDSNAAYSAALVTNTCASTPGGGMGGQSFQSDAGGLFTAPDGSFSALMLSPNVSETSGKRLYTSHVGPAKYEVTVIDMVGADQALVGYANRFLSAKSSQGYMHSTGVVKTIGGYPALEFKLWNLFKKSGVVFIATDKHLVTFSAVVGIRDSSEQVMPFFNSIRVH
jgi:hypothetical protein